MTRPSAGHKETDPSMMQKTPVSWLHELCTRNNVTPKYDLLQIEGAVHEPIFQYRLHLEFNSKTYEETGSGRSKKEAKHNAARAMLRSMEVVAPHELFEMEDSSIPAIEAGIEIRSADADGEGNPVGILQELCMKLKYPPPVYEVAGEEGLPHERLFAMACRVGDQFVEIGKGKSKKLAKRTAAFNMAQRLKAMPLVKSTSRVHEDDDDVIIERIRSIKKSSTSTRKRRKKRPPKKVADIENSLPSKASPGEAFGYTKLVGPLIESLRDPTFIIDDPVAFVKKLSAEQHFEAIYIDSEDRNTKGDHQIMVQITFEPPLVLIGEGKTFREAKKSAARDVIAFFAQMIKKTKKELSSHSSNGFTTVPTT